MLGFYNYTVVLTYVGMLTAFFGVVFAIHGSIEHALLCLMISGFCDMFDGLIASTMKNRTRRQKNFGIQIDSMSDLICFGVLPAIVVLQSLDTQGSRVVTGICGLYLLCTLIRLSYFNVDEAERQEKSDGRRENFQGLPVTSSALVLPLIFCLCDSTPASLEKIAPCVLLVMAIAFLTPFHLKKPALFGKLVLSVIGIAVLVCLISKGGM